LEKNASHIEQPMFHRDGETDLVWFTGFGNGLLVGDEIEIEFFDMIYRVRIVESRILPSCVTPYLIMEVIE